MEMRMVEKKFRIVVNIIAFIILVMVSGCAILTPSGPKPVEITIDRAKTALLLLHWQNDIVSQKGKLSGNLPKRLEAGRTIEHTQAVLKASREKEMLIVYVNLGFRQGYPELPAKPSPLISQIVKAGALVRGTWGAEVIDQLKPLPGEVVINNFSPSAFDSTELDLILRNHGITNLVLTGVVTNWVIESTARDAASKGYFNYIIEDCCNSWEKSLHNWSMKNILPMLGDISNSARYVDALEKAKPAAKKAMIPPPPDIKTIDPSKTAFLSLHMENDVVTKGGRMAVQFPERLAAARTIENIQAALKASREKGMLIIYVVAGLRPGYPEMPEKLSPLASLVVKTGAMVRGTWGSEIREEVKPLKDEIIIYNFGPSAFWYTDLDMILRNRGITNLVLTGVATNFVVESTARDAVNKGYFFYILKDGCISLRDDMHNFTLTNVLPMLGVISDSKAYIEALGKSK